MPNETIPLQTICQKLCEFSGDSRDAIIINYDEEELVILGKYASWDRMKIQYICDELHWDFLRDHWKTTLVCDCQYDYELEGFAVYHLLHDEVIEHEGYIKVSREPDTEDSDAEEFDEDENENEDEDEYSSESEDSVRSHISAKEPEIENKHDV